MSLIIITESTCDIIGRICLVSFRTWHRLFRCKNKVLGDITWLVLMQYSEGGYFSCSDWLVRRNNLMVYYVTSHVLGISHQLHVNNDSGKTAEPNEPSLNIVIDNRYAMICMSRICGENTRKPDLVDVAQNQTHRPFKSLPLPCLWDLFQGKLGGSNHCR